MWCLQFWLKDEASQNVETLVQEIQRATGSWEHLSDANVVHAGVAFTFGY